MNLRALRCFLAVAEELHFGRAAKRLNISQPPLTQHIKSLELELGARLFDRTKRSVQITEAGTALLDEARLLIARADGLRRVVQRADKGRSGTLRAGFITSAVFTRTRLLYATMSRGVPGATVMWQEMNSSEQVEALREGKIDIGFLHTPSEHRGLEARVIVRDPMVVAVPDNRTVPVPPLLVQVSSQVTKAAAAGAHPAICGGGGAPPWLDSFVQFATICEGMQLGCRSQTLRDSRFGGGCCATRWRCAIAR